MKGDLEDGIKGNNLSKGVPRKGLDHLEEGRSSPISQPSSLIHLAPALQRLHSHVRREPKDDRGNEHPSSKLQQPIAQDKKGCSADETGLGDAYLALHLEHHRVLAEELVELLLVGSDDGLGGFGEGH